VKLGGLPLRVHNKLKASENKVLRREKLEVYELGEKKVT
jgi:hypothetical protein